MCLPITASYASLNINAVAPRLGHERDSLCECTYQNTRHTNTVESWAMPADTVCTF